MKPKRDERVVEILRQFIAYGDGDPVNVNNVYDSIMKRVREMLSKKLCCDECKPDILKRLGGRG